MVSTAELTSMKAVLEGALTQCVTETIKAKPANPVLFLAHRLIQYAQMPPMDPLKAAAPSKPATAPPFCDTSLHLITTSLSKLSMLVLQCTFRIFRPYLNENATFIRKWRCNRN